MGVRHHANLTYEELVATRTVEGETMCNGTACRLWAGTKMESGYGLIKIRGRAFLAHKHAFVLVRGEIAPGMVINHLCYQPACVNVEHLEACTQRANLLHGRGVASRNAKKTHCPAGHLLSGSNVRWINGGKHRRCAQCERDRDRRRHARSRDIVSSRHDPLTRRPLSPSDVVRAKTRLGSSASYAGEPCLIWTGALDLAGYGTLMVNRKRSRPHRVAYEAAHGPIPDNFTIDHLCKNRACCNPAHLEAVSKGENTRRAHTGVKRKRATRTHCKRGHDLTPDNTRRSSKGSIICKTCQRLAKRQYKQRHQIKMAADPEFREQERRKVRQQVSAWKADPAVHLDQREKQRASYYRRQGREVPLRQGVRQGPAARSLAVAAPSPGRSADAINVPVEDGEESL